jgi:hypothetical protein
MLVQVRATPAHTGIIPARLPYAVYKTRIFGKAVGKDYGNTGPAGLCFHHAGCFCGKNKDQVDLLIPEFLRGFPVGPPLRSGCDTDRPLPSGNSPN